jgi:CHAT domain-containing protein
MQAGGNRFSKISRAIGTLAALPAILVCAVSVGQEIEKFVGKPVSVSDRFETDTRANYRIVGDVQWSTLKLIVPAGASLLRAQTIEADFRAKFDIWTTKFDTQQQSVSRLTFALTNGGEVVVTIARERQAGRIARQAVVSEVQRSSQASEPDVEHLNASPVFSVSGDVEHWSITFKNGVVEVRCNDQLATMASAHTGTSWCTALAFSQLSGETEITLFSLQGREAGYSAAQRRIYEQTLALRAKAEEALAAGDLKLAVRTEQQRIPLMEKAFGKDHSSIALVHGWVADVAKGMGRHDAAKRFYGEAADVYAKSLGEDNPETLRMRVNMADASSELGQLDEAEAIARPAANEYLRIPGKPAAAKRQVAILLYNILSKQQTRMLKERNYRKYLKYTEETAALMEALQGPNDNATKESKLVRDMAEQIVDAPPDVQPKLAAMILGIEATNELAARGHSLEAQRRARETLAEARTLLGSDHYIAANALIFLAVGEMNAGNFGVGLQMLEEAVTIREKRFGKDNLFYAYAAANLASGYSQVGRYADATPLFEQSIKLIDAAQQQHSLGDAFTRLEYGRHLIRIGNLPEAFQQLTQCIAMYNKMGAGSDPNAIVAYERLGDVYRASGDIESADKVLELQKRLLSAGQTARSAATVTIAMTEAKHLYMKRQFAESARQYQQVLNEIALIYGKQSRAYESALEGLLEVRMAQQDRPGIEAVWGELMEFARLRRESLFATYSLRQQFEHSASDRVWLNRLMALAANNYLSANSAYEHVLEIKGAVTRYQRRTQIAAAHPQLRPLLARHQTLSSEIAGMLGRPLDRDGGEALLRLAQERNALEREMSLKSAEYRQIAEKLTIERLQSLLAADAVLVDYVQFERPPNWLERVFTSSPQPQMAAFVVGKSGSVKLIHLGSSRTIDPALFAWRRTMGEELQNFGPVFEPKLETSTDQAGARLRTLIWDPLGIGPTAAKQVIISPDGVLLVCPFAALPLQDSGHYLIERSSLSQLPAIGLLPELSTGAESVGNERLLILGNVDYDSSNAQPSRAAPADRQASLLIFENISPNAEELTQIRNRFGNNYPQGAVVELLGAQASERSVRQAASNSTVLHLETHGFCVSLAELQDPGGSRSSELSHILLGGIALAGANRHAHHEASNDGILWADEIATLDLRRAGLVTLSACNAAVGTPIAGEGMQGPQRAFLVAGARSSLSSLWASEVNATRAFMARFYANLWEKRLSKSHAAQQAMIYMLREYDWRPADNTANSRNRRCPPLLWSNWVFSGEAG